MAAFEQKTRPLRIDTPLGPDAILLTHLSGSEGISELFEYALELMAPVDKPVDFSKILGQAATIELDLQGGMRYFHGYINRFSQGSRDQHFIHYRAQLVPQFWFLTKRTQSRIFQHIAIPDILKKVLDGLKVTFDLQGKFEPRDYCVQYRESDFDFACRLMEEEGIYWFYKHTKGEDRLVVGNAPSSHPDLPVAKKIIYDETSVTREDHRITSWEKVQEIRSGKVTLWDHCFELPHVHLEADKTIPDTAQAGTVTHKLKVGGADKLELYDFPGGYAQRFDGIDRGGGAQPANVQKIFDDNKRTVGLRMQEEAAPALQIHGVSNCAQMHSGFKFTLDRHIDANGDYLLTRVSHDVGRTVRPPFPIMENLGGLEQLFVRAEKIDTASGKSGNESPNPWIESPTIDQLLEPQEYVVVDSGPDQLATSASLNQKSEAALAAGTRIEASVLNSDQTAAPQKTEQPIAAEFHWSAIAVAATIAGAWCAGPSLISSFGQALRRPWTVPRLILRRMHANDRAKLSRQCDQ